MANVDVDDVGEALEALVPHVLDDHGAREHAPGIGRQVLEQCVLLGGELDAATRAAYLLRETVDLEVADLEVDRLTQQVKRAGRRIELTPKEYALLEYLMSSPGRVFSRTMIIEHVWDQSFEGLTNIVDVYVRHLRSKIDDPFPVKLIRTVRGVGYGLAESSAA